jgi:hypothetical protein
VVPLPDDDPDSIILICKIIHIQTLQFQTKLTITVFANLAIVCNKYDCLGAVRAWSMIWVAALLQTPDAPEFEKLFLATYLLDLPQEFFNVSQSLIRDRSNIFSITTAMDGHEFLPVQLYETVLRAQIVHQKETVAVFGPIAQGNEICDASKQRVAVFFQTLLSHALWPISRYSVPGIKAQLVHVNENETSTSSAKACTTAYTCCSCKVIGGLKGSLGCRLDTVYNSVRGLCLDCTMQRTLGKPPTNCRIGHGKTRRLIYP